MHLNLPKEVTRVIAALRDYRFLALRDNINLRQAFKG